MSCRVLGRGVEEATLNLVGGRERGGSAPGGLVGEYVPTAKNGMVRDHYETLGFLPAGRDAGGSTRWTLSLRSFVALPVHMRYDPPLPADPAFTPREAELVP